jgi:hypothetical protein
MRLTGFFNKYLSHSPSSSQVMSPGLNETPHIPPRQWKGITLDDIDKQWQESKTVHPAFGRQICHFAAGIEETLKERNFEGKECGQ